MGSITAVNSFMIQAQEEVTDIDKDSCLFR